MTVEASLANIRLALHADELAVPQQGGAGRCRRQRQVGASEERDTNADIAAARPLLQTSGRSSGRGSAATKVAQ